MIQKKEAKIVILGSADSGKTTTIENLLDKKEKVTKIEHNGTTVALDYGNIIIEGEKIHIFASPGQERFKFMREILSKGLDGAIVVIDNSVGVTATDVDILDKLNSNKVPYAIFANKQDISPVNLESEHIKADTTVIPTIALSGEGIHERFEKLLKMMKN